MTVLEVLQIHLYQSKTAMHVERSVGRRRITIEVCSHPPLVVLTLRRYAASSKTPRFFFGPSLPSGAKTPIINKTMTAANARDAIRWVGWRRNDHQDQQQHQQSSQHHHFRRQSTQPARHGTNPYFIPRTIACAPQQRIDMTYALTHSTFIKSVSPKGFGLDASSASKQARSTRGTGECEGPSQI